MAVKRWTKNVNIFAVRYIIIPVHLGVHWCLCVSLRVCLSYQCFACHTLYALCERILVEVKCEGWDINSGLSGSYAQHHHRQIILTEAKLNMQ